MNSSSNPPQLRDWLLMLAVAAIAFLSVVPTITWIEFCGGSENLNVATALEIRRTRNWLIPTLQGQPRIAKPPLTAWMTAATIRRSTLNAISSPDQQMRERGFRQLAWDVRWPALLAAALTAAAVYELGRLAGGWQLGLISGLICATTYAFMRYARASTTDVQLALWVVIANVFLARTMLLGQLWLGLIGAAVAAALGFLSKGPVALAQTAAPAALVAAIRGWKAGWQVRPNLFRAIGIAVGVMLIISLPWFVIVAWKHQALSLWWREVTREGATDLDNSPWWSYFAIFHNLAPWTVFFVAGLLVIYMSGGKQATAQKPGGSGMPGNRQTLIYMLLLVLVPILIMSLVRDRKERYLLPMIGPASVLAGYGLWIYMKMAGRTNPFWQKLAWAHWGIIAAAAVVFPLVGMTTWFMKTSATDGGGAWFGWKLGTCAAGAGAIIVSGGYFYQRRNPWSIVAASVLALVLSSAVLTWGYAKSANGQSELRTVAERIWQTYPGAEVYTYTPGKRGPQDLSIYLNRSVPPLEEKAVAELPAGEDVRVLVVLQKKGGKLPPMKGNWRELEPAFDQGKDLWHWFVWEQAR